MPGSTIASGIARVIPLREPAPPTIRDPAAYDAAVDATVWHAWLNNLARCATRELKGQAMIAACEAVEQARPLGSSAGAPPHIRKILNEIADLDKVSRKIAKGGVDET